MKEISAEKKAVMAQKLEELIALRDKVIMSQGFNWDDADLLAYVCNFLEDIIMGEK